MTTKPSKPAMAGNVPSADKLWQMVLIYPTLAIALLTAVPQWVDRALAVYHGVQSKSFSAAENQNRLWQRNIKCLAAPPKFYSNLKNIGVDATICKKTGDIFVQIAAPDAPPIFHWVDLDEILSDSSKKARGNILIPEAKAETANGYGKIAEYNKKYSLNSDNPYLIHAQYYGVVCQRIIDGRNILRHISTPQGCFDEIIDTFNGVLIRRSQVPCRSGC